MKVAVFFSAGLGDALLLVPLINELKRKGSQVSGIFTSSFHCEDLFVNSNLFDDVIITHRGLGQAINSSLKNFKKFDISFLNYFAATKKNFLLASSISKKIISNNSSLAALSSAIEYVQPIRGIHDATQNLRLLNSSYEDSFLKEEMFALDFNSPGIAAIPDFEKQIPGKFFSIQISSGNNIRPFKNWPARHWVEFLKKAENTFPDHYFVLLGEPAEQEIADTILKSCFERVISFTGKTEIYQAAEIIRRSELFIGLDGGLMHIAAAAGKPTFTIWGGSDPDLYGYEKINPSRHKIVFQKMNCGPCNSWINPNITRVKDPLECPDFICMNNLTADFAFSAFEEYYKLLTA